MCGVTLLLTAVSRLPRGLVSCVRHYAEQVSVADRQEPLARCFRALELVFQFVARSRQLFARQSGADTDDTFRIDLAELFNVFNRTLSSAASEAAVATQVSRGGGEEGKGCRRL